MAILLEFPKPKKKDEGISQFCCDECGSTSFNLYPTGDVVCGECDCLIDDLICEDLHDDSCPF